MDIFNSFLFAIISYGIPLLYGTVGEIITEKSGSLNLGVEGTMAIGGVFGYVIGAACNSLFMGILMAAVFAGLTGLLFAYLTVTLKANQNVTGLAITTFGVAFYFFMGNALKSGGNWPVMTESQNLMRGFASMIPGVKDVPVIGAIFGQNVLVYLGILIAVAAYVYLFRTKAGLRTRAIGENPAAADAVGINVNRCKYLNIVLGSAIMGIGGLYMGLNMSGSFEGSSCWINGYGWISIALVIFAKWNPLYAILGTFVFGFFDRLQVFGTTFASANPAVFGWLGAIPVQIYKMLPFLITAIVLVIASIRKNKENQAPAAIGLNYIREER